MTGASDAYYSCTANIVHELVNNANTYRLVRTFSDGSGSSAEYFDAYPSAIAPHTPLRLQVFNVLNTRNKDPREIYSRLIVVLSEMGLIEGIINTVEFCAYVDSDELTFSMLLDTEFKRDPDIREGILRATVIEVLDSVMNE